MNARAGIRPNSGEQTSHDHDDEVEIDRSGGTDLFRGAMVALMAFLVGGFLILQGFGGDDDNSGSTTAADQDIVSEPATDEIADADEALVDPADEASAAMGDPELDGSASAESMQDESMQDGASGEPAAPTESDDSAAVEETDTATAGDTSTSAARPPSEVKVLVLNATTRKGIAATGTEMLQGASFATAPPGNAVQAATQVSAVYFAEGYEAEAKAVAVVFSAGLESLVKPLDPANSPAEDDAGANVIVVLANDGQIPI